MCIKKNPKPKDGDGADDFVCRKCGESSGNPFELCKAKLG